MSLNNALIECVPNFSEGRDLQKIEAICNEIVQTDGVKLLHKDIGYDANRTVLTFAGSPEAVLEAAFQAIKKASAIIDLRRQEGAHPRIGAIDVCPLVPLSGISPKELVELSYRLGDRIGQELSLPVYLYEESSQRAHRKRLEQIRKGQFEKIKQKIKLAEWAPDFGPKELHPSAGALVLGVRKILVAYNISLDTKDVSIAKSIAAKIRTAGNITNATNGNRAEHAFQNLKALGWYMEEYGCAQVSTNITDYKTTNMAEVFEKVKALAHESGITTNGSELIGLLPLEAILDVGKYYNSTLTEEKLISLAIQKLGMDKVQNFDPQEKILDYVLRSSGLIA